jgi:hypothetical protein
LWPGFLKRISHYPELDARQTGYVAPTAWQCEFNARSLASVDRRQFDAFKKKRLEVLIYNFSERARNAQLPT